MLKRTAGKLAAAILILGACTAMAEQTMNQTRRIPQFENDDVKVWRSVIAPHQPLTMHRHDHPRVIIALGGGTLKVMKESGPGPDMTWEAGKAYWLPSDPPGEVHGDVNEGDKAIDVIVVELKKAK